MVSEARMSNVVLIAVLLASVFFIFGLVICYKLYKMKKITNFKRNKLVRVSFGAHRIDYFPPRSLPNRRFSGVIGPGYFVSTLDSFKGSVVEV